MPGVTEGHTYLNKPAASSSRFVYVRMTFFSPPDIEGLTNSTHLTP